MPVGATAKSRSLDSPGRFLCHVRAASHAHAQPPLITGGHDFASVTDLVCDVVERKTMPRAWTVALGISSLLTLVLFAMIAWLIYRGIGVWGLDILTGQLKSPSTDKDIMGYCEPNWISDYVYERFYAFNAAINNASMIFPEGEAPSYEALAIGAAGVGEWLPELHPVRPLMGATRPVTVELDDGSTKTVDAIFHAYDHLDGGVYLLPKQGPRIRRITAELAIAGKLRRVVTTR